MIKASGKFRVVEVTSRVLWLELRESDDKGKRVSIPKRTDAYSEKLQSDILDLRESQLIEATIVSKDEASPNWYLASVSPV